MNVLFVHQNFPAQFRHLAGALSKNEANRLFAIGSQTAQDLPGVALHRYSLSALDSFAVHPFARRFDIECRRAEQIIYIASELLNNGFRPDTVFVHSGWGEAMPLRTLFPSARIITYCEYFYQEAGLDVNFDPEWPPMSLDSLVGLRAKNAATLLALSETDVAISPTHWQRSTFPPTMQQTINVRHDGIDVTLAKPDKRARVRLPGGALLQRGDRVVTFVARNLEPLRGYHIFVRALDRVLRQNPHAQIIIIGNDGVSYGANPPEGKSWKNIFLDEVKGTIDLTRVHFLGHVSYHVFLSVLQISTVHVYLTYPFVLSWSLLEAMAVGCTIIGSATAPVQEVVNEHNGILVNFFDYDELAHRINDVLGDPAAFGNLGLNARQTIVDNYEREACVRQILDLI